MQEFYEALTVFIFIIIFLQFLNSLLLYFNIFWYFPLFLSNFSSGICFCRAAMFFWKWWWLSFLLCCSVADDVLSFSTLGLALDGLFLLCKINNTLHKTCNIYIEFHLSIIFIVLFLFPNWLEISNKISFKKL